MTAVTEATPGLIGPYLAECKIYALVEELKKDQRCL
jgi:hypothetical protein